MQSHACCTVPAVLHEGYEPKGSYSTFEGAKTYVTGSSSAKAGILMIADIFGFFPQTLQGADILASGDKEQQYQVFIPGEYHLSTQPGQQLMALQTSSTASPSPSRSTLPRTYVYIQIEQLTALTTHEQKDDEAYLGKFFDNEASIPKALERIPKFLKAFEAHNSNIKSWALVGFCWGGKVVNLSSKKGSLFKAAAVAHPAFVDPDDAPEVEIPFLSLPSKDEDKEAVEKWQKGLKVKNQVEFFPDQIHGFMAAR